MRPRLRTILLVAAVLLVVSGLLVAGPAHLGLHGAGDNHGCDACAFHGASPEAAPIDLGPPRFVRIASELPPTTEATLAPRLLPPARGPPRSA